MSLLQREASYLPWRQKYLGSKIECPFCPLVRKTDWYLTTDDGIVVCRDLDKRGFKYRILVVGSGKEWHRPVTDYSKAEMERFLRLGREVAKEHILSGLASLIDDEDMEHFKFPSHFHIQLGMR